MRLLLLLFLTTVLIPLNAQHKSSNRAFLGITSTHLDNDKVDALDLPTNDGSMIKYVYNGTAAKAAGLQPFDYIIGFDDNMVNNSTNLDDLLAMHRPGDQVKVQLIRQGKKMTVPVTLGRPSDSSGHHDGGSAFLGVREHDRNDDDEVGVRVETVRNSSAIDLGLDDGDVITSINGNKMVDWHDISIVLNNMDAGDPIEITYLRNNSPQRATGEVGGEDDCDDNGGRGYLGIYSGHMDRDKANELDLPSPYGSYVKRVIPGSGAEAAGLEPLDYIVAIDDYQMSDDRSLTGALNKFGPGDEVIVTYIRNGQTQRANAILGEASDDNLSRPCAEEPFFGVSANHNVRNRDNGVPVNIVRNSSAKAAGLQSGDIITSLAGKPILDWGDLSAVINGTKVGKEIAVGYVRDGQTQSAIAVMGSECNENGDNRNESNWYDYNYDNDFDDDADRAVDAEPAVDMDRIQVEMADMDEGEAEEMARRGVDMPLINNLTIENIQLFPNPNRGMFRLEFDLPQQGETSIRVFNSEARLIYSFDLGQYQGTFSDDIDISQNGPGAYFLEVRQGNTSMVKKVLLQY
ncbi:MAG: PDZ domain-containing protein [Bacteroidota bacterium]